MSFDLILWRGEPEGGADLAWSRLAAGDQVAGLEPFSVEEVVKAFTAACRDDLRVDGGTLEGRGFTLVVEDGAQHLHVTCAWAFAGDDAKQKPIRDAARRLDATIYDPQTARRPQLAPKAIAAETAWGTSRSIDGVEYSTVPPDRGALLDQVHALVLHDAGRFAAAAKDLVCHYARFPRGALPFERITAAGSGTLPDGTGVGLPHRRIGIVDGQLGFLASPVATLGNGVSTWRALRLEPAGPAHDPRGAAIDLTARVAQAAEAALVQAHAGDTLPLREWVTAMVSIDSDGRAAFADGEPELHEAGAVLRCWVRRAFAAMIVEARLRLPRRDAFELAIVTIDRDAPDRTLPPPLGG